MSDFDIAFLGILLLAFLIYKNFKIRIKLDELDYNLKDWDE